MSLAAASGHCFLKADCRLFTTRYSLAFMLNGNLCCVQHTEASMRAQISSAAENEAKVALTRNKLVLDQARAVGLLGTAKNTRLSGRVPSELIEAAKKRAHVTSDTELLELALARLALEDDFGARLVGRKGSIPADVDLGL
ncbi:hypothetical protein CDO30_23920 (plasmid) [Sinorhizobium meliloti]|uniref:Uncharacterized protein n=2 Tax=Rhizobium meliloti TaxID=382 RepID=Q92YE5_RHIME|nr:hypothetical protein SMa1706 [Sinorhizobium meliloti 1021]ASP61231.1 hypothetical protein CDO30_23920 [Sinorhizobium meliloti]MQW43965.1 hypothetical protein [Sinorhizobium meliloti]RVL34417.1 hypothetical protein CN147_02095 [Sinorhizobium meliloti]RVL45860.1 hypothetical protein CN146_10980 [Sinorhizobium meliloti]